jgi:ClpP class serine protease
VILGPNFNFSQIMEKWGIQATTLTEGKDKDVLNPFRPWREGEDEALRRVVAGLYDQFVTAVTENRPKLNREKLVEDYGAHLFLAPEAEKLGYIDNGNSSYSCTIALLAKAAGIEGKYQVMQLKPAYALSDFFRSHLSFKSLFREFFLSQGGLPPELSNRWLYFYTP